MEPNALQVESFLLCRSLEVVNNAFYILGGGWSTVGFFAFPGSLREFYVAVRLIVPFTETAYELEFDVRMDDEDGRNVLPHAMKPRVTVGRPVELIRGEEQAVHIPLGFHDLEFPHAGTYVIRFLFKEKELARTSLEALHLRPGMSATQ